MKTLIILLLASVLVKVASLTLRINSSKEDKEIRGFYENESFRKFLEHDYDYKILRMLTRESKNMPFAIKERSKDKPQLQQRDEILNRTWYQDYLKIFKDSMSLSDSIVIINTNKFPEMLQNTALEENAKNEIWRISHQHNWFENEFDPSEVKGMIKNIKLYHDSLSLEIAPFYFTRHQLFDACVHHEKSIPIESNPFYYKGSLHNWRCTALNPVTNKREEHAIRYN